jgi:hypothetical protein
VSYTLLTAFLARDLVYLYCTVIVYREEMGCCGILGLDAGVGLIDLVLGSFLEFVNLYVHNRILSSSRLCHSLCSNNAVKVVESGSSGFRCGDAASRLSSRPPLPPTAPVIRSSLNQHKRVNSFMELSLRQRQKQVVYRVALG